MLSRQHLLIHFGFQRKAATCGKKRRLPEGCWVIPHGEDSIADECDDVSSVLPDYFGERPKPCMSGWGREYLTVTPDGRVLPCPAAAAITTLQFDNVRERSLGEIWRASPAFEAYRGTAWMPEPCRSCDRRSEDFGGCRCQAFLITHDANATDPTCSKAPDRHLIDATLLAANQSLAILQAEAADSFSGLQERTRSQWSYRVDPK